MKPGDVLILLDDEKGLEIPERWRKYIGRECTVVEIIDATTVQVMFLDGEQVRGSLLQFRAKDRYPREWRKPWSSLAHIWRPKDLRERR